MDFTRAWPPVMRVMLALQSYARGWLSLARRARSSIAAARPSLISALRRLRTGPCFPPFSSASTPPKAQHRELLSHHIFISGSHPYKIMLMDANFKLNTQEFGNSARPAANSAWPILTSSGASRSKPWQKGISTGTDGLANGVCCSIAARLRNTSKLPNR